MLMDNTSRSGSIDVDQFQRAMLVYRNSIDPETRASPAMVIFGRPIRDPIPIPMGRYCPHSTWKETLVNREVALAKRHTREREKWEQHTRELPPLRIGDHVYLQNLTGNHPKHWERTGMVVEVRQYHQYVIRIDGSGRLTLRNRQHLRRFTPFKKVPVEDLIESLTPPPINRNDDTTTATPSQTDFQPPPLQIEEPIPQGEAENSTEETRLIAPEIFEPIISRPGDPHERTKPKISRELKNLQAHNTPGLSESVPLRRKRNRCAKN